MRSILIIAPLLLTGCIRTPAPIVSTPPARCADLIPVGWKDGVEAAPVPDTTAPAAMSPLDAAIMEAKQWAGAYVAQDGQLDKANGRTADTISIVRTCEAQANAARPGGK